MQSQQIKKSYLRIGLILLILSAFLAGSLTAPTVNGQTAPSPAPAGSSFEQRLAQRKAERNVTLDEKSQKRLITTCVAAQGKIRAMQQKTTPALTSRVKAYQQMDAKLWVMIGKLKIAEKDTFKLEQQRATLVEKSSIFQETSKSYQQSLDDLVVVKCQQDPIGFKTMLDTARLYRGQLRDQSTDIRNYMVNDIKASLSGYAAELQVKPSTEDKE